MKRLAKICTAACGLLAASGYATAAAAQSEETDPPAAFEIRGNVTQNARLGRESSDFIEKWDWQAGFSYCFGSLTASVAYGDSNHGGVDEGGRQGRGTVVALLLAEL